MWVEDEHGLTQGAIVDGIDWGLEDNPLGMVLSNACDLEHGKSSFLIVAAIIPAKDTITSTKEYLAKVPKETASLTKKQKDALKELLGKYIHNKDICRYYFFDTEPVFDLGLALVDFQRITSVEWETAGNLEVIAQLRHPFVEQMMMRFVAYTSRIPSDRVSEETETSYLEELSSGMLP